MVAITNYSTLVQAIKDEAEDDGTEFSSFIPTAIDLAEERLFRELDLPDLELEATGTLTASSSTLNKPSGYEFASYLAVTVGSTRHLLKKKTKAFIKDYWPDPTETGTPKYYTDNTSSQFLLAPTPASTYAYELFYTKKPTKLSTSSPTNYYTTDVKDLLFYACMSEMSKFMKAWSQVQVWENEYLRGMESWNLQMMRNRRDANTTPESIDTVPNTLRHTYQTNS